ncbi:uncharacterized protein LOC122070600 [Macadamia integrifolia]|uniref:uncharacterized protein LOC122070600 n=1 Tax=Macadamia integrifolia TaxID=60698 RepID=UPI001C500371|nr:uncharacterized protein LOC122070600 [Macadamia integrifolia]
MDDIRKEAKENWNLKGGVKMAPMGKGYILFQFERDGDMAAMWRRSLTRIRGQVIRFQPWKADFDVHAKNVKTKLVWIKFPDLPLEYWHEKILLTMAKASGRPVELDRRTQSAAMGTFARVQVEVEIGATRLEEIQVERRQPGTNETFWFKQNIIYEDALIRCGFYKKMGHFVHACRVRREAETRKESQRKETVPGATYADEEDGVQSNGHRKESNGHRDEQFPMTGASNLERISFLSKERSPSFFESHTLRNIEGKSVMNNLNGDIQICLLLEEEWNKEGNIPEGCVFEQVNEGENDLDDGADSMAGSDNGFDGRNGALMDNRPYSQPTGNNASSPLEAENDTNRAMHKKDSSSPIYTGQGSDDRVMAPSSRGEHHRTGRCQPMQWYNNVISSFNPLEINGGTVVVNQKEVE